MISYRVIHGNLAQKIVKTTTCVTSQTYIGPGENVDLISQYVSFQSFHSGNLLGEVEIATSTLRKKNNE